ncbi:poly-gamma-glutamate hydrolase family protein [Micromonospora sp. WMMD1082]|uniref:poly-gamma-glutamate hydrolase family protein n=1 Tax=Micromonospora sp. WMMD1082 TaxID=3016104 RepID=UPI002417E8F9|nr:poly-gamma-glutamate hydrolase family protein [Micromonospora sp. WMMD1082]MDG4797314.1 poly-gamma-glutamate hydrolase family protein [Micromonospora sp. WMMD1082]
MTGIGRRTMLTALAGAAVGAPALVAVAPRPAVAAPDDLYQTNSELYASPTLTEGVDYARRFRRHGALDDDLAGVVGFPNTVVIAPHGGGIEVGTSELGLAVAGYHPATLTPTGATYDYWMFEGLRAANNGELHVTSTGCDDPQAESFCGGARYAVSLHGCTAGQLGLPDTAQAVAVGGLDAVLRTYLRQEYAAIGVLALDAPTTPALAALAGVQPRNIVNRTLSQQGAQLELSTPLRNAMFGTNTRAQRRHTTLPPFWSFVTATRAALARRGAG